MKQDVKRVLIAGGTGFLGYHAALKFAARGVAVDVIALPREIDLDTWFPKEFGILAADLFALTETEVLAMMSGGHYDAFVYALGPDDRTVPKAPAFAFFQEKLVFQSTKICRAAKRAGIGRCVVLGSYFAHFDRLEGGKLSRHHPYIRARIAQEQALQALGETGTFDVMTLELPFIFGTMPARQPLWKEFFLDHFARFQNAYFPRGGGTAAIDVSGVAEAVYAATVNGDNGRCYPVGKINIDFKELLTRMLAAIGEPKRVILIPPWIAAIGGAFINLANRRHHKEGGLNYRHLMTDILCRRFYLDFETLAHDLDYEGLGFTGGADVLASIDETLSRFRKP